MCKRCASCGKPSERDYCDTVCREAAKFAINPVCDGPRKKVIRGQYSKSKLRYFALGSIA